MSVWKRLANVAKGTVKQWQREDEELRQDLLERELTELERHPAPGEQTERRRRVEDRPAAPVGHRRNPAEEPVKRTDLFGEAPGSQGESQAPAPAAAADPPAVREGADGRKL